MKVNHSRTNINELVQSVFSFFKPEADAKEISLICKNVLYFEETIVSTDYDKVFAILSNLVKNAIKFTHNGYVELGYRKENSHFEFFVKDTGVGISPEQGDYIFERFRQGSESLTRNYEGTGLGLSISKAYAEMLGGKIWFESKSGVGSVFYFILPYVPSVITPTAINDIVPAGQNEKKIKSLVILIVEDNIPSEMLMTRLVRPFSKKILKVTTGSDAIEACRNNPDIDLVMMDVKLPGIDGYESTQEIRRFNKDLIIIAQTAFGLMGEKEKALEAGCTDYISKPINRAALLGLIEKYFKN